VIEVIAIHFVVIIFIPGEMDGCMSMKRASHARRMHRKGSIDCTGEEAAAPAPLFRGPAHKYRIVMETQGLGDMYIDDAPSSVRWAPHKISRMKGPWNGMGTPQDERQKGPGWIYMVINNLHALHAQMQDVYCIRCIWGLVTDSN
jgi:hypothetical protein